MKRQPIGEIDDTLLVDGLTGDKSIYRRRSTQGGLVVFEASQPAVQRLFLISTPFRVNVACRADKDPEMNFNFEKPKLLTVGAHICYLTDLANFQAVDTFPVRTQVLFDLSMSMSRFWGDGRLQVRPLSHKEPWTKMEHLDMPCMCIFAVLIGALVCFLNGPVRVYAQQW